MTNPFDIRRESDTFDGLFIVYDVRDGQTCRSFPFTVKRTSGEEYIPAAVAQAHAEDFAAELWARELADAPSVATADDTPSASPEAPTLTETFTPEQFPSDECVITPTSIITLEQDKHRGENSIYLVVDGKRHWLALWLDGFQHQQLLDACDDALEAALRVRDRLLRIEFEQQVADEPPVPVPTTRIEYDHNADLFVAYVDGCEVTAAPTQSECNAALDALLSDDGQPLDEETASAMAAIMSGDGLYSFDDTALDRDTRIADLLSQAANASAVCVEELALGLALDALHEGDIVRDALGDVHRIAHIGSGVLPVVTFRAGRLCHWRACDLVRIETHMSEREQIDRNVSRLAEIRALFGSTAGLALRVAEEALPRGVCVAK